MLNRIFAALLALALCLPQPALASDLGSSNWSETAASNNAASPNGWTSGTMLPSQVEPTAREMMSALKKWWNRSNSVKTSGGAANVQTLTYDVAESSYYTGQCFAFIAGFTNTAATTLNVSALGAKNVKIGSSALVGGEIVSAQVYRVCYDGTQFQLTNPSPSTGTWTPSLTFGGASVGMTCSVCTGNYTKVGSRVIFDFEVKLTALGSSTGDAVVNALPFTPINNDGLGTISCGFTSGMSGASGIAGYVNKATTTLQLTLPGATGISNATQANFSATSQINCSGSYQTS